MKYYYFFLLYHTSVNIMNNIFLLLYIMNIVYFSYCLLWIQYICTMKFMSNYSFYDNIYVHDYYKGISQL